MSMEININCDLGEKSKHHSNKHDPELLEIVNSANVACGYHATLSLESLKAGPVDPMGARGVLFQSNLLW